MILRQVRRGYAATSRWGYAGRIRKVVSSACMGLALTLTLVPSAAAFSWLHALTHKERDGVETLWEGLDGQFVRLEPQDAPNKGESPNDHPVALNADAVRDALAGLEIFGVETLSVFAESSQRTTPVFTSAEIDVLAVQAAKGLKLAGPHQDLVFAMVGMHPGAISKERQVVAGRRFYTDHALHIIFGDLHRPLVFGTERDVRGLTNEVDRRLYPYRSGARAEALNHRWRIVARGRVRYAHFGEHSRDDWAVITMTEPVVPPAPDKDHTSSEAPRAEKPLPTSPPGGTQHDPNTLRQRLKVLKQLRDDGLIGPGEYRAKRRALLDEL